MFLDTSSSMFDFFCVVNVQIRLRIITLPRPSKRIYRPSAIVGLTDCWLENFYISPDPGLNKLCSPATNRTLVSDSSLCCAPSSNTTRCRVQGIRRLLQWLGYVSMANARCTVSSPNTWWTGLSSVLVILTKHG